MVIRIMLLSRASADGVMLALFDAKYDVVPGYQGAAYINGDSPCWFCARIDAVPDSAYDRASELADKVQRALDARGVAWLGLQVGPGGGTTRIGMKLGKTESPYRSPA